jgi:hypothetical protein
MFDREHVFRRAFSWLPAHFASQSDTPVGAPREFRSTEHLSTEMISSYVDGEVRMVWYLRASTHLAMCPECVAAVEAQEQARAALRESCPIDIPAALLGQLAEIPLTTSQDPPPTEDQTWPRRRRR